MSENITHTSDEKFQDDVIDSDTPVLVDYWAEWCGPCKMIAPILEEVASEYTDRLKICKMDVDASRMDEEWATRQSSLIHIIFNFLSTRKSF